MKVGGKKNFNKIYNPMQRIEDMSKTLLCQPKKDLSIQSCKFYCLAKDILVGVEDDGQIIVRGSVRGYLSMTKSEFKKLFKVIKVGKPKVQ